jgi:hypothetical protein
MDWSPRSRAPNRCSRSSPPGNGRLWSNLRVQPKTAFSRFPPIHWADPQGQQRVDMTRSPGRQRTAGNCAKRRSQVSAERRNGGRDSRPIRSRPSSRAIRARALVYLFQGERLGRMTAVLQRVSIALGSPPAAPLHPADASLQPTAIPSARVRLCDQCDLSVSADQAGERRAPQRSHPPRKLSP